MSRGRSELEEVAGVEGCWTLRGESGSGSFSLDLGEEESERRERERGEGEDPRII
jgi:hypothetical protein